MKPFILVAVTSSMVASLATTLVFVLLFKPVLSPVKIIPSAQAQTQVTLPQVTGSPNIAVAAYRFGGNTFILWANGEVTTTVGPRNIGSRPTGSPNVAVGFVVPLPSAPTQVINSDGSTRSYP